MTPALPHCATPQMRENQLKIKQFIQQYYPGIIEKLNLAKKLGKNYFCCKMKPTKIKGIGPKTILDEDDAMAQLYNTQCRDKQGNKRMHGESWKENCNTCW